MPVCCLIRLSSQVSCSDWSVNDVEWTGVLTLPIDQIISQLADLMKCNADSFQLERSQRIEGGSR